MLGRYIDLGAPVSDHPLNYGLVSWWLPLPHNSGAATLFDLVPTGRSHGTLTNGPTWTAGPNGFGAVSFDGTDDYVVTGSAPVTAVPLTLACWFRSTSSTANQQLVSVAASGSNDHWWSLNARGGDVGDPVAVQVQSSNHPSTFEQTNTTTGYTAGRWHFACGVFAANNDRRVYIDGGSKATGTLSSTPTGINRVGIGVLARSSLADYTFGDVTDVRVYNRALSDAEVFALYEQSLRGHPDTLRRYSRRAYLFATAAAPPASLVWHPLRGPLAPAGSYL